MEESTKDLYQKRLRRFHDAIGLRVPDRVPIASLTATPFFVRYSGLTQKEAAYDYDRMAEACKNAVQKLNWDVVPFGQGIVHGPVWEILGVQTYKWTGYNLPDNATQQYIEKEYMLADEYRQFLSNPGDFTIRTLLPRYAKVFEPLKTMPPVHSFCFDIEWVIDKIGMTELNQMMQTIVEASDGVMKRNAVLVKLQEELREMGYPVMSSAICTAPFDWIANSLRGLRGILLDMYRNPDELLATIDLLTPVAIDMAIDMASKSGDKFVFIPLHRGSGPFLSNEQFARFYWPSLRKEILAFTEAGLVPIPYWMGDWTSRLEFMAELPKGQVASHFDVIDIEKAKRIVGDRMCFWGNVPGSLLALGRPQEVKDYVKLLIDTFGDNGGLIVDAGTEPTDAKSENIEAMTEAVFEHGVYRP